MEIEDLILHLKSSFRSHLINWWVQFGRTSDFRLIARKKGQSEGIKEEAFHNTSELKKFQRESVILKG